MKKFLIASLFLAVLTVQPEAFSQGLHTSSSKAAKAYADGSAAYDYLNYPQAEEYLIQAIKTDSRFYEAYMMLGELMTKMRRFPEAASYYKSAVRIDSLFYKPVFFSLANAELMSGDYANALLHYKVYLAQPGLSEKNKAASAKNIKNCEFALDAIKHPVPFSPVSVGTGINTIDDEYWPSITADGQTLMFTRQSTQTDRNSPYGTSQEDFFLSFRSDSIWQRAVNAGSPLSTSQNEGAQTLSSNGTYMYFTACDRSGGMGSCDIYFSAFSNGRWTEPSNLMFPVNTQYWESQPSISADGRTLYFSSSRPGGCGGKDIWYSALDDKNKWSQPVNISKSINTEGDEMSPFIHFDGKSLYFASNGKNGMGGFDIYLTRRITDSTWSEPRNIGYPINTFNDEMGLIIESTGKTAYYSSIRDKRNGKDIFTFNLYESARPDPVSYLKGRVFDKATGAVLKADYELINLSTGKVAIKSSTDEAGDFLVCLPSGFNYGINVSKEGYLFYSENFMLEGEHPVAEPFNKKINLNPVKVGAKMQLSNVFYEVNSAQLKDESKPELDHLAGLLNENRNIAVEIGGYTDSTGTAEFNLTLSEKRALSVVNYLIGKGIQSNRLKHKGYGNSFPVGSNETEEGRRLNRRTEVKIIEPTR